jgi:L-seryl-tRNA(Ser) seleniumtransferase
MQRPPSIDRLLQSPEALGWLAQYPRELVLEALRQGAQAMREGASEWQAAAQIYLLTQLRPSLRPVLNGTGVVLHTNLGRAPLSPRALEHINATCGGYCNLELDLESGQRGQRHDHLSYWMSRLAKVEGALAVNNCAAAMLLIVDEFARGKEVLVSRGELVEIGGSFRVPDVLTRGGAKLVEVGTTNRTYTRDFEAAITPETGMLLSTHLSNFVQQGFVHSPEPAELTALARERGILSVLDLGSGLLQPDAEVDEPNLRRALTEGWDLIAFSGDKLLGGAQAGIIVGRPDCLKKLAKNPWMRALRLDKLRLAALQGTLLDHLLEPQQVPVHYLWDLPLAGLKRRAQRLANNLGAEVRPCRSSLGGGTTPGQERDSWALFLKHPELSAQDWATRLRQGEPALLTRVQQDFVVVDLRTITDDGLLEKALRA